MHRIIAAVMAAGVCAGSLQAQTRPPASAGPVLTLAEALAAPAHPRPSRMQHPPESAPPKQRYVAALRPNPSIIAEASR